MNKIIHHQKKKFQNIELYFNLLLKNIHKLENLDNLDLFLKKLYLFNKSLDIVKDNIIKLLDNLEDNNNLILSKKENNLLEEDKNNKLLIDEVKPILLYYLLNKNNF